MNVSSAATDFTRSNSYGKTADCMLSTHASLRPVCCCKDRPRPITKRASTKIQKTMLASLKTNSARPVASMIPPH
ncbi:hypothetical protein PENTCL1PPCAC_24329 [Pristionchus entomophagus]|uniref:Uncharacterized protein n=1 Tax=Pristionchus entomophagus TaxID=358040 RepID=A0AAV5U7Q2_9BILA|nr:hypothetical protein PENTCL1PPCAC_24328 [Pristionchus entomophagus]GMT02155.1 hypothetical protein PENTCL1PPCAC_24329 [Pristionchus entomophagus]